MSRKKWLSSHRQAYGFSPQNYNKSNVSNLLILPLPSGNGIIEIEITDEVPNNPIVFRPAYIFISIVHPWL